MTDHQQAAIEAAEDALRADIWDGDPEDIPPTMGREAELAVAAALPAIEKQIREQVAADIWGYWPFRRTARYREAACHSTGEYRQAPRQGCGVKTPATIAKENTIWLK